MTESGQMLGGGRYRIESVLGQGGMGAVYLASMEALGGKKVAIKEMELRGFNERELQSAVKQFSAEANFLAHLDHPNLVQVTDFFVEGDKHYLVMAYVRGQTLQQKLRARGTPFGWLQVLEWARPLCSVLTYLHTQNPPILFRDLKPSNIMVEESGRLKLIDFGIARTGDTGERTSTFLQGTGTSGFSPIEQYGGGQSTDPRSDIYSLGATLYQMLTGKVPPDAVSRVSQGATVPPPSSLFPELPKALDPVLLKALAQSKGDRHQSVAGLAAELEAVARGEDSETEDLRPPVMATMGAAASLLGGTSQSNLSPNITVELVPSGPTATPLQQAGWLGAAAVITLVVGMFFMRSNSTATGGVSSDTTTPRAPVTATATDRRDIEVAESARAQNPSGVGQTQSASESRTSASDSSDRGAVTPNHIRQVRPAAAQPQAVSQPASPPRPVVRLATARLPSNEHQAARPASPSRRPSAPPVEAAPTVQVDPETTSSQTAAIQDPATSASQQVYAPTRPGDPPAPPPNGPQPRLGPDGRPLPWEMQNLPGGGPPESGPPPGYQTTRRRGGRNN